jgi:hypothetical protein
MSGMAEPFCRKLELVLKALSTSRGRLAADLGVDKSIVGRWVSRTAISKAWPACWAPTPR